MPPSNVGINFSESTVPYVSSEENELVLELEPATQTASKKRTGSASNAPQMPDPIFGAVVGQLVAIVDEGRTPLVTYPGQPGTAAIAARTAVDLFGPSIGQPVVLMFENADARRPIIMGVLREGEGWPLAEQPGQVQVDADGQQLMVSAKEQLVLRCGKASITLTKGGKVLIKGEYVLNRSSGVNRVKGGSVQLN
jgi:hypothetical protein